jgi:type IV pilus assembly protein PilO
VNLADINSLDINSAGNWPAPVKAVAILIVCVGVLGAGYWFDTRHQIEALDTAKQEETKKKQAFEAKQRTAANLEPLKNQLEEMKQSFGAMLRQLPNQAEIDALLVDISQTGLAAGLEFELFQPQGEVPEEFYAVKPIKLRVSGDYHEFGEFVSGVAALPRIVTQHDISIKPVGEKGLVMEATAKTYRYIDEDSGNQKGNKK